MKGIIKAIVLIIFLNLATSCKSISNNELNYDNFDLAIMIETNDNKYQRYTGDKWPTLAEGYTLNIKKSSCDNGGQLSFEDGSIIFISNAKNNKCNVYFEIDLSLADYIKNLYNKNADIGDGKLLFHDGEQDYSNEDNYELEVEDKSYRYTGANPNNYVCFGTEANPCPEDNLYRIIGLFLNDENKYELKLIKNLNAKENLLGTNGSYRSNDRYYWQYTGNEKSNSYWPNSLLNTTNLNTNYLSKVNGNLIADHYWRISGNVAENIIKNNAKLVYEYELGSKSLKLGVDTCYYDKGSRICTEDDLNYKAKIGLMYISDYMYAADSAYWSLSGCDTSEEKLVGGQCRSTADNNANNDYRAAKSKNWLYFFDSSNGVDDGEWTITSYASNAMYILKDGSVYRRNAYNMNYPNDNNFFIRPSFYLNSDVKYSHGVGTKNNPYYVN